MGFRALTVERVVCKTSLDKIFFALRANLKVLELQLKVDVTGQKPETPKP